MKEQNLCFSSGVRAVLFCLGLFLALQAIFIAVFIFQGIDRLDAIFNKLLGAWGIISALAGFWLVLKASQNSGKQATIDELGRTALLGSPDQNLSLASICAAMQEGVALLQDEKIVYANPALAYLLGMQQDELIDTAILRHIHPEDIALLDLSEKNKLLPSEGQSGKGPADSGAEGFLSYGLTPGMSDVYTPNRCTMRMTTSLGDYRWVICNVHFMLWEGQETTLLLLENIGSLKQAQRSLEEHEQQSRIFLERTPLGVAMFDALGQMKIANTAWHAVWSNITGSMPKRFNIMQDPFMPGSSVELALRQAFNKKEAGVSSLEHSTPWGETRWFNINFHPMLTPVGNLIGVIMIQQDITDQMRSLRRENELNEQLAHLRREYAMYQDQYGKIADLLPGALISYDGNNIVRVWNRQAEERFGLPAREVVGKHLNQAGDKLSAYAAQIKRIAARPDVPVREEIKSGGEDGQTEILDLSTAGLGFSRITVLRLNKKS